MDVMNYQQAEREAERMQVNREELVERIARAMRHADAGYEEAIECAREKGLNLPMVFY